MLDNRQKLIIGLMCQEVPPHLNERFAKRHCVAATRVGLELLKRYGISAEPVPVNIRVLNYVAFAYSVSGLLDKMSQEECLAAGIRYLTMDTEDDKNPKNYPGHLVLKVDELLLDLDVGQFAREDIDAPDARAFRVGTEFWDQPPGTWIDFQLPCGGSIGYTKLVTPFDYTDGPDWYAKAHWFSTVRDVGLVIDTALKHFDKIQEGGDR